MPITYIVVLTYIKPLKDVDEQIPAHIEWLKKRLFRWCFSRIRKKSAPEWGRYYSSMQ
jgi:hypothetical protein